jgi:hypothetical protein
VTTTEHVNAVLDPTKPIVFEDFADTAGDLDCQIVKHGPIYWQARVFFSHGTQDNGYYGIQIKASGDRDNPGTLAFEKAAFVYRRNQPQFGSKLAREAALMANRMLPLAHNRLKAGMFVTQPEPAPAARKAKTYAGEPQASEIDVTPPRGERIEVYRGKPRYTTKPAAPAKPKPEMFDPSLAAVVEREVQTIREGDDK